MWLQRWLEAMQAREQAALCGCGVNPGPGDFSRNLKKKNSIPERNKKHFPGHVDTRLGGGLTGSAAFDFIVITEGDDTHAASLSSAFSEGGGSLSFSNILPWEGGV